MKMHIVIAILAAIAGGAAGSAATYVTLHVDSASAATSSADVAPKMRSLGYYLRHDIERGEKIAYCENNPGLKISDPECTNAQVADGKLHLSTKEVLLPKFPE